MPPLRLSGRAVVAVVVVALLVGLGGVLSLDRGEGPGGTVAADATATTAKARRAVSDAVRSRATSTTGTRPTTTTDATGTATSAVAAAAGAGAAGTTGTTGSTGSTRPPRNPGTTVPLPASPSADPAPSSSATSPPNPAPTGGPATTVPVAGAPESDAEVAARVVASHNQIRAARGLPALQRSSCLDGVARDWAGHLAVIGALVHNVLSPLQSESCMAWREVGENVGYDGTIDAIESAWMSSGTHAANILDPDYTQIGVGVARSGGLLWIVVNFAG